MNYYNLSKTIDLFDTSAYKDWMIMTDIGTPAYYRYHCIRWLAWYRVFYRQANVEYRKKQITYFIEDLQSLYK